MKMFKTLDIRGLSFFKAYQLASEEFKRIKKNGILELIVDKQKNFTEDFSKWAKSQGGKIFNIEDRHGWKEAKDYLRALSGHPLAVFFNQLPFYSVTDVIVDFPMTINAGIDTYVIKIIPQVG